MVAAPIVLGNHYGHLLPGPSLRVQHGLGTGLHPEQRIGNITDTFVDSKKVKIPNGYNLVIPPQQIADPIITVNELPRQTLSRLGPPHGELP